MSRDAPILEELIDLLGKEEVVALCDLHGGRRLFVPVNPLRSELSDELGMHVASKLSNEYGGLYLRVPLARELRAEHYLRQGRSYAKVARILGITENSVYKLKRRLVKNGVEFEYPYE